MRSSFYCPVSFFLKKYLFITAVQRCLCDTFLPMWPEESRPQGPLALAYASGYHGDEIAVDPVAHILTTDPYTF